MDLIDLLFPPTSEDTVVRRHGLWTRSTARVASARGQGTLLRDKTPTSNLVWSSLILPVGEGDEIVYRLDNARLIALHNNRGLLVEAWETTWLLPSEPRLITQDYFGRIREWQTLGWQLTTEHSEIRLAVRAPRQGWIELVWLSGLRPALVGELLEEHPYEQQAWAVEGCWSTLRGLKDFWHFWAIGTIYGGRPGAFGRFPSQQAAWSLYKIMDLLAHSTGKQIYNALLAELAYSALAALDQKGRWQHGEWLEEPETHMRFQIDGIHLLMSAYERLGDLVLLEGAERAAAFVLRTHDELNEGHWWYLHDTLELDLSTLRSYFPAHLTHRAFGKQLSNTLTLNTHVSALVLFHRLGQLTQQPIYDDAFARGLATTRWVLASSAGTSLHLLAECLLELTFENHYASWPRRALRAVVRGKLIAQLNRIQSRWPRFVTPGGYLWRDLTLPAWGYWYHLVNLYDLIMLYECAPQPWLHAQIERAIAYTRKSNLIDYLLAQHHYIVPQWLQILARYRALAPGAEVWLDQELQRVRAHGYAVPPEIFAPPLQQPKLGITDEHAHQPANKHL